MVNNIYRTRFRSILPILIIALGMFLRWYRVNDLLGFQYDQGRDALVIRKLIMDHKFFLVGPVTGLEGIFLGPLFYYLLAPFYWIGSGNPGVAAIFLSSIYIITMILIYRLGSLKNYITALLALSIYAFSVNIIWLNRWLSNPPPIMLTGTILILACYRIATGKTKYWPLAAFAAGASLHFEAASGVFYLPLMFIFTLWQWKNRPAPILAIMSTAIFLLLLLPQILFDFRHNHLLSNNIKHELFAQKSFQGSPKQLYKKRLDFYVYTFGNKLFAYQKNAIYIGMLLIGIFTVVTIKYWLSQLSKVLILFISVPLVLLLFFQGNHGNVYDYYLSGYFVPFILLISLIFGSTTSRWWGKLCNLAFISSLIIINIPAINFSLKERLDGPIHISLGNQLQAVNWVYQDASEPFNIDVYVPPVIPYAYDYLFNWIGDKYHRYPVSDLVPTLYTLYEEDPPHPERLEAWLARQKGIGIVKNEVRFGGITVQKRTRI